VGIGSTLIYGLTELVGERPVAIAEAALIIVVISVILLPIGLMLMARSWGLLRLALLS